MKFQEYRDSVWHAKLRTLSDYSGLSIFRTIHHHQYALSTSTLTSFPKISSRKVLEVTKALSGALLLDL